MKKLQGLLKVIFCMAVCLCIAGGVEVKAQHYDVAIDWTPKLEVNVGDTLYFYCAAERSGELVDYEWSYGEILTPGTLNGDFTVVSEGVCEVSSVINGKTYVCIVSTSGSTEEQLEEFNGAFYGRFSQKNPTVAVGKSIVMQIPNNKSPQTTRFRTEGSAIARVTDKTKGIIEGKKAGEVVVYAINDLGQMWRGTLRVSGAELKKTKMRMEPKQKYKIKIKGVSDSKIANATFKSADTSIATVGKKGVVKAKKIGKTTVYVTVDSVTVPFTVNVKKPTIEKKKMRVVDNQYEHIHVEGAGKVTYKVPKKYRKYVKVTKNGVVLAKGTGDAVVIVKTYSTKFRIKVSTCGSYTKNWKKWRKRLYKRAYVNKQMLEWVNEERERIGLKPLKWYSGWEEAVKQRAVDCIILYEHERPYPYNKDIDVFYAKEGIKDNMNMSGENIAWSAGRSAFIAFMKSEGHYENMMQDLDNGYFCCGEVNNACVMVFGYKEKFYYGQERKDLISGKYDMAGSCVQ